MTHPHLQAQSRIPTPLGTMTAAASAAGLAGLWFDGQKHHPGPLDVPADDGRDAVLAATEAALTAYFSGRPFTLPPLDPAGTAFQREVWQALLAIEPGCPDTYGHLARRLGQTQAARAVGAAVGRNPISILIPCHRVVGAGFALTGYAGSRAPTALRAKLDRLVKEARGLDGESDVETASGPLHVYPVERAIARARKDEDDATRQRSLFE